MLTPEQLTRVGDTYLPAHLGIVITEVDRGPTAVHIGTSTHVWDAVVTHRETGRMVAVFRCSR
jgi:hypothetical protein